MHRTRSAPDRTRRKMSTDISAMAAGAERPTGSRGRSARGEEAQQSGARTQHKENERGERGIAVSAGSSVCHAQWV